MVGGGRCGVVSSMTIQGPLLSPWAYYVSYLCSEDLTILGVQASPLRLMKVEGSKRSPVAA